jgi:hypothetical protein
MGAHVVLFSLRVPSSELRDGHVSPQPAPTTALSSPRVVRASKESDLTVTAILPKMKTATDRKDDGTG